ncbi:MAG TPA: hypothetical protein ENI31_06915 [Candidatus Omnitrophica bacterium]|nr:MAG: hypothetical protein DRP69_00580 [Candidatus Omnitrophota bacterium]RKY44567.1 MAG: hypothetical protein DRP80_01845 [Candidatus Omnitrophota bacterium]HEC69994.1 hypothetical protein [Candidatus Omnitrophota bacterium]
MKIKLPFLQSVFRKVSIDWGSSALKIVSGYKFKDSYFITDFLYQNLQENFSEALSKFSRGKSFLLPDIILSLDGPSTLVRVVDFPRMDKKMIRQSLSYELSKYIPFSAEEVYFDFSILNNTETRSESFKLLIVSAKKDFVEEKIRILEEAGLIPLKITLSPIVLSNAFLKFFPQEGYPAGLLDLGYSSSLITVVYKDNIHLSRQIKKGAKDILESLSNVLGKPINNFRDLVAVQRDISLELLSEVCSDLIEEIKLSLDYLETKENLAVKKIYSTGGLTACKGIEEFLARGLGIEVCPFNLLKYFKCKDSIKKDLEELKGNFSVAISSLL